MTPDQYEEQIAQLEKSNAAKTELISISAHQLRTSIAALKWILKMLSDGDLGSLNKEQQSMVEKALESSNRMNVLVQDLLTLNHTEELSIKYSFAPHDITEIIENVLFEFSGESHEKGLQVVFLKPDEEPPNVHVDEQKIRVVIQNLVENAIKYSTEEDKVIVSLSHDEGQVTISVKDSGIGIPEEEQEQIFEKFFRASNAEEKDRIGSGLGLYTTKRIIEQHGGTIWFESTPGEGTTFSFSIPRADT